MPSLDDPYLKVRRAYEHLKTLDRQLRAFHNSKPYRISAKNDLKRGEWVITIKPKNPEPPLPIALVAGDVIDSLRAALDYLAWQLAATNGKPCERVTFPIRAYRPETATDRRNFDKTTKGIPSRAVTIMQELQPYQYGDRRKFTHLWRLNKLAIISKHRHIPLASDFVDIFFPGIPKSIVPSREIVDDCGVVRFPLAAKQYVKLNPRVKASVNFGNESEGIIVTPQDLVGIYEFVQNTVLPQFVGFFTKGKVPRQTIA